MRALVTTIVAVLAGLAGATASAQSGGGFEQTWSSIDAGGRLAAGGAFSLHSIVAQPDAATTDAPAAGPNQFAIDGGLARGLCGGTIETYGSGCPGTAGIVPQFAMGGCPSTGYDVTFEVSNGLGGAVAFVFVGLGEAAVPMGFGCTLNVSPLVGSPLGPIPLSAGGPGAGSVVFPATVPPTVPSIVLPVTLQVFVEDPFAPGGFSNTNGVRLTLG